MAQKFVGLTPKDIIRRRRLQDAAHAIRTQSLSLGDIAARCGYSDHPHFVREFKQCFGTTPQEYRQELKDA